MITYNDNATSKEYNASLLIETKSTENLWVIDQDLYLLTITYGQNKVESSLVIPQTC